MRFVVLRRRLRLVALLLLYASVAGIAASTVLAELGQEWWIADLFAHFRYHYVLGAALLIVMALALGAAPESRRPASSSRNSGRWRRRRARRPPPRPPSIRASA